MSYPAELQAHLDSGATTLARTFALIRKDGRVLGFTDHDRDLSFDGIAFRAETGLTAKALDQATGLSVDNTEVAGLLRSDAITEADILAGLFDGAAVTVWVVNWAEVSMRQIIFRGTLGEIVRTGGAFTAELRGLSEALNRPHGRIYHARCSAVLGDAMCGFDPGTTGYHAEGPLAAQEERSRLHFCWPFSEPERWFEKGVLRILSGPAAGMTGLIKTDRPDGGERVIELWQALGIGPEPGDLVRLEAGCDKRMETCRVKFGNLLNFRGFPDIPGEDWLASYPVAGEIKDGGSRRS